MSTLQAAPSLSVPLRFLLGVVAGTVSVRVMDLVMTRLPEGEAPPSVASGVLTDRSPDDAPARLATVVHYLAGLLTGPLFVWLLLAAESLFGGPSAETTLTATVVLYALMVGFFAVVVLPQSSVASERRNAIKRDWAVSAAVYLAVLVPVVFLGSQLLAPG